MCHVYLFASRTVSKNDLKVSFRLNGIYKRWLQQAASEQGMSVGQYARFALVGYFEQERFLGLSDEVRKLRQTLLDLQANEPRR